MGRIEDALRQAGKKSSAPSAEAVDPFALRSATAAVADMGPQRETPVTRPASHREKSTPTSPFVQAARLVLHKDTEQVVVEQYRKLAAVLHHAQVERGVKVVMLASAQASEGKTLTAANLALTLSESYGRRVLLIDADLRRPSIGRVFGVSGPGGLSDCLRSRELQTLRVTYVTDGLGLLLAGQADHDPMAGLTSGRMQEIIEQASEEFDWVLIDTPPIALLSDAHLLAAMVDVAVFVISAGTTQHQVIQRAVETIGREKIVGVVLNRVDASALAEASYDDYYRNVPGKEAHDYPSLLGTRHPTNAPERTG
jgi:protein-tyrosine kinase